MPQGDFGDYKSLSPYLSSLPYMLDRARAKNSLLDALIDGHVICDRYTTSNIIYQAAKLPEKDREDFISFIEQAEYGELGLPMPNLVIFMSVPLESAIKSYKKNKTPTVLYPKKDKYEDKRNIEYQKLVVEMYKEFSRKRINWFVVDCMNGKKRLSPEEIHKKIYTIVGKYLNIK
jgi:dTMP kinase